MTSDLVTLEPPDTSDIETEGNAIIEQAEAFIVQNAATYETAGTMLLAFKGIVTRIKDTLKPAITHAHKAHKALTTLQNERCTPFQMAEATLKGKMAAWHRQEQERIRREQEAALAAQRKADEEREAKAEELRKANQPEAAEAFVAATPTAPLPVVATEVPKVKGISTRKTWGYKIVDPMAVKRPYLSVNEQTIRATVKSLGKLAEEQVGGIEVFEETTIAGRTG